jgi:hypothetical protein
MVKVRPLGATGVVGIVVVVVVVEVVGGGAKRIC